MTRWTTSDGGEVEVTDVMPVGDRRADIVRRIRGIRGEVAMHVDLRIRFDYADALPWVRQTDEDGLPALVAIAGPDAIVIRGAKFTARDHAHTADFTVRQGETRDLVLTWYPSHRDPPDALQVDRRLRSTTKWWTDWAKQTEASTVHPAAVRRSLLVLRALTHEDTGGIVAAATTSLPEQFGGQRNWDYRFVWLRDASLTLHVLLDHGFRAEADAWRTMAAARDRGRPGRRADHVRARR